jgi:hypothetical protein
MALMAVAPVTPTHLRLLLLLLLLLAVLLLQLQGGCYCCPLLLAGHLCVHHQMHRQDPAAAADRRCQVQKD